jgi:hypothetical protein
MADIEKTAVRSSWVQFFVAQAVVLLIYSLGLAYWLGGFANKVEQVEKATVAQQLQITDLDRMGTQPGRLDTALNASQERRIQILETNVNSVNTQLGILVTQVGSIDKKLDALDAKK